MKVLNYLVSNIRDILGLIVKVCVVVLASLGLFYMDQLTQKGTTFLYFTNQSNLAIAILCGLEFVLVILEMVTKKRYFPLVHNIVKLVITVAIALTGLIFMTVLLPTSPDPFKIHNVLTHMVVPLLGIIDFFLSYETSKPLKKWMPIFSCIPPLYYLVFASIGYVNHWDFGGGNNYPYPFLNWGSSVGAFGFGGPGIYFMGSFYWIFLLLAIVLFLSYLFYALSLLIFKPHSKVLKKE